MSDIKKQKTDIASLKIGMYVCDLDIPWSETTFPLQGFPIDSDKQILKLASVCKYVYIDLNRSENVDKKQRAYTVEERKERIQKSWDKKLHQYKDSTPWKEEYPKAKEAVTSLSNSIKQVFMEFQTSSALDITRVKKSVDPMIESIRRNPDACIWLARMKSEDDYIYEHSISSAIWAVALGRQIGLDKTDLKSLALGALLFDIGKLELNQETLKAPRNLTEEEFREVQKHVNHSLKMIRDLKGLNKNIIAMIAQHHERHDGSGYPKGTKGDDIHIFARIAAIADCYDAITSKRPHALPISPSEAVKKLYQWRNTDFQSELVEEFIQAIGIYPAGSLVELSNGEVAIVLAEYRTRRLRPEVLVLLDKDKQPVKKSRVIKLYEQDDSSNEKKLDIVNSLEPKAYGIDMQSIRL